MRTVKTELEKIRKETRDWLLSGEQAAFAEQFELTTGMISHILTGRVTAGKYVDKLLIMHKKAMENKERIESITVNGSTHE